MLLRSHHHPVLLLALRFSPRLAAAASSSLLLSPSAAAARRPSPPLRARFHPLRMSSSPPPPPPPPVVLKSKVCFCQACGSPTKEAIPDGEEKMRPVCTSCGRVHYENPKMVRAEKQMASTISLHLEVGNWNYPLSNACT